jgi:uncharacterized protein YlxW (UPF0749 family)
MKRISLNKVMAKLAEENTTEKVELSVADDVMDFVRSIPFDTGYIRQALKMVEQGTNEAERTYKEIVAKEKELKEFQAKVNDLGIKDEVNKAKNVLSNLKQMKMAFRDMSKNGKAAVAALKAI